MKKVGNVFYAVISSSKLLQDPAVAVETIDAASVRSNLRARIDKIVSGLYSGEKFSLDPPHFS